MFNALRTGWGWTAMLVAGATGASIVGLQPADAVTATGQTAGALTSVNIRSGPGTAYKIVGGLERGQRITATGGAAHGWVKVHFERSSAYIFGKYLAVGGAKLPPAPSRISTGGVKITTEELNVRTGPGVNHPVVGTLGEGAHVTLTGKLATGYAQLRYSQHLRWVSMRYLAGRQRPRCPHRAHPRRVRRRSPSPADSSASRTDSARRVRMRTTAPGWS